MMKTKSNIHIFAAAMVLLLAASCQKDGVRTLNATFERYEADGKAFVDDDHYACWEDDDLVSVNGTPCAVTLFSGIAQARSAHIVVPEDLDGQNLLAFYPADRISNMPAATASTSPTSATAKISLSTAAAACALLKTSAAE